MTDKRISEKRAAVIGAVIGAGFVWLLFFVSGIPLERSSDLMVAVLVMPLFGLLGMVAALLIHSLDD